MEDSKEDPVERLNFYRNGDDSNDRVANWSANSGTKSGQSVWLPDSLVNSIVTIERNREE